MKVINIHKSVGAVLCHDITQIIPGEFKGPAFRKGHVIKEEDIPVLLSLGKEHIFVWEDEAGMLHENEAAIRLKDLTGGEGLYFNEPNEGKITFYAAIDGLLKIDKEALLTLNCIGEMLLSTIHENSVVKKGDKLAATKIIPLTIEEEKIKKVELLIKNKIVKVIPIHQKKVALITTGNEVYSGRIKDASLKVLKDKLDEYQCEIIGQSILPDDLGRIEKEIQIWYEKGAEIIICTGGMSVDPDDVTPIAIINTSDELITYGSPVLPGAMLVLAYKDNIPILGLPAGVVFSTKSVFDLILPRILAQEKLTAQDIAIYGHGGLL